MLWRRLHSGVERQSARHQVRIAFAGECCAEYMANRFAHSGRSYSRLQAMSFGVAWVPRDFFWHGHVGA